MLADDKTQVPMAASLRSGHSGNGGTEPSTGKPEGTKYRQLTLGAPRGSSAVKGKKQILKEIKGTTSVS